MCLSYSCNLLSCCLNIVRSLPRSARDNVIDPLRFYDDLLQNRINPKISIDRNIFDLQRRTLLQIGETNRARYLGPFLMDRLDIFAIQFRVCIFVSEAIGLKGVPNPES